MTRLVLLNGAPGSGKSTLARRWVEDHPLALALDIDVVRGLLGGWLQRPVEAGLVARRMALQMARVQLEDGRDVVVPQFLARLDFVEQLERLSQQTGAEFVEIVLLSSPQDVVDRFVSRSSAAASRQHADAEALLDLSGGVGELPAMYARLLELVASRPRTHIICSVAGEVERAHGDLCAVLDG